MLKLIMACGRSRQRPSRGGRFVNTMMADGTFMAIRRSQRDDGGKFESIGGSAARWWGDIPPFKQAVLHVANNCLLVAIGNRRSFRKGNFPWKVQAFNETRLFCVWLAVNGLNRAEHREVRIEAGRDSLHAADPVYVTDYTKSTTSSIGFSANAASAQNRCHSCTSSLIFDLNEYAIVPVDVPKRFCDGDDRDRPRK